MFYKLAEGAVAVAFLYFLIKGAARLWFNEKEKHLDRVLKKVKKE